MTDLTWPALALATPYETGNYVEASEPRMMPLGGDKALLVWIRTYDYLNANESRCYARTVTANGTSAPTLGPLQLWRTDPTVEFNWKLVTLADLGGGYVAVCTNVYSSGVSEDDVVSLLRVNGDDTVTVVDERVDSNADPAYHKLAGVIHQAGPGKGVHQGGQSLADPPHTATGEIRLFERSGETLVFHTATTFDGGGGQALWSDGTVGFNQTSQAFTIDHATNTVTISQDATFTGSAVLEGYPADGPAPHQFVSSINHYPATDLKFAILQVSTAREITVVEELAQVFVPYYDMSGTYNAYVPRDSTAEGLVVGLDRDASGDLPVILHDMFGELLASDPMPTTGDYALFDTTSGWDMSVCCVEGGFFVNLSTYMWAGAPDDGAGSKGIQVAWFPLASRPYIRPLRQTQRGDGHGTSSAPRHRQNRSRQGSIRNRGFR